MTEREAADLLNTELTDMISFKGVDFSYENTQVLNQPSMEIKRGTTFGLIWASGSGKTTLMRLLTGVIEADAGKIRMFGDIPSVHALGRIGYMPQLQALYTDLSVEQNIDFFARMFSISPAHNRRKTIQNLIEQMALLDQRNVPVAKLSGGQRQRVSLAIALIHAPSLLILDEPTVGLDPQLRAKVWDIFYKLVRNGTTLIISTHQVEDARRCNQVGFLQFGRMIAQGSPTDLMATANNASKSEDAFLYCLNELGNE